MSKGLGRMERAILVEIHGYEDINGEMDRVSQQLTQRVKELAERYETPLPHVTSRVAELEAKVNRHLERMGFSWK